MIRPTPRAPPPKMAVRLISLRRGSVEVSRESASSATIVLRSTSDDPPSCRSWIDTSSGDELLGELHRAHTDTEDRQTEGQAEQRGVQVEEGVVLLARALVLPRPEEVDADEREGSHTREGEPECDVALGTLLGAGAFDGPPLLAERDVDAVEVRSECDEVVAAHLVEVLDRVLVGRFVATHDLAPIHSAAPTTATMPTTHIAGPSAPGPNPPSPYPPGSAVSLDALTYAMMSCFSSRVS